MKAIIITSKIKSPINCKLRLAPLVQAYRYDRKKMENKIWPIWIVHTSNGMFMYKIIHYLLFGYINLSKYPVYLSSIQSTRDTIDGTLHCKRQTNNMTTAADGPPTNVADMKILPKKDWLRNPKVSSICVFDIIDDGSK